jgi:hypothetical protein
MSGENLSREELLFLLGRASGVIASEELKKLVALASEHPMTEEQRETQRRSFAYGNTHFENENITRETVDRAAAELAKRMYKPERAIS